MAKIIEFTTNLKTDKSMRLDKKTNTKLQLRRKFKCLSKDQKMYILFFGFGYLKQMSHCDQNLIFEGMLTACGGDYEAFEEEIDKMISNGRKSNGKI